MDYNRLNTFIKVADAGSITEAARQMRRSQSAISQQMQLLEEELGLALLERKGGKVLLSKHGEQIRHLATAPLAAISEGILDLKSELREIQGSIRLGILNNYGNSLDFGNLVGSFCKKHPQVRFDLLEGTSTSLEQALLNNEIDLSIQVYFENPELVQQIPIEKARHSLFSSPKYLENYGKIDSFQRLIEADLIDLTETFICLGTFVRKNAPNLAPTLMHRKPNVAAPNHQVMKSIVKTGFGIAILPDYLAEDDVKSGELVKVLPRAKSVYAGIDLAHRSHRSLRLAEKIFVEHVKTFTQGENK